MLVWQDDPIAAEPELRPAYEALKKIGEKSHFSSIAHALSHALYAQGRYDEAERLTHECEEASRPNDIHSQISWRSIRAKILAEGADTRPRRSSHGKPLPTPRESDFLLAHAEAMADLAEVLELGGKRGEAIDALRRALELDERKGNLLAADRARARLAVLSA